MSGEVRVRAHEPNVAMFEYQPPAVLNQAAPVNGDWYTILDTTENVRVYDIAVNVEDDNETLEVEIIIGGETITASGVACTHSTAYYARVVTDPINRIDYNYLNSAPSWYTRAFLCEGHSIQVRVRKTTAAGVGNLTGIVTYGVLRYAF